MNEPRQTKIVATLGPATDGVEKLQALLAAGMNCVRINCSYGDVDDWRSRVNDLRSIERKNRRSVPVIFDLQGPKMRLLPDTTEVHLTTDTQVRLAGVTIDGAAVDGSQLVVDQPGFVDLVVEGSEVVIGDGIPRLMVTGVEADTAVAVVATPGRIGPGKGVTVLGARDDGEAFTAKDRADLAAAIELDAEFIAVSYVRSADDVTEIIDRLRTAGSRARVIAKIEQIEAYDRLDEILDVADGVMVARGDLGVAVGSERVPLMQKQIIRRATQAGKLVITATQMLESMINSPEPTRAEAADVANAVIDGTSAVMLSAETSTGSYPIEAVTKMASIALAAEGEEIRGASGSDPIELRDAAVMHAALYLSHATGAVAMIVPTSSGNTARSCVKYRPKFPIIAITDDPLVSAQLNLEWGIKATTLSDEGRHAAGDFVVRVMMRAKEFAGLQVGDTVVVTAGPRAGFSGATNTIAVRDVR